MDSEQAIDIITEQKSDLEELSDLIDKVITQKNNMTINDELTKDCNILADLKKKADDRLETIKSIEQCIEKYIEVFEDIQEEQNKFIEELENSIVKGEYIDLNEKIKTNLKYVKNKIDMLMDEL